MADGTVKWLNIHINVFDRIPLAGGHCALVVRRYMANMNVLIKSAPLIISTWSRPSCMQIRRLREGGGLGVKTTSPKLYSGNNCIRPSLISRA